MMKMDFEKKSAKFAKANSGIRGKVLNSTQLN